ncbi:MAG: N-sulfoglucosamine sulfohydrolase [Verrucomicrobiales bacterium]|jgi:N-sulfoglucosamine sulfohydrolase
MKKFAQLAAIIGLFSSCWGNAAADDRPNIVFAIADDWGWPHASIYENDEVCQTPNFDVIARNGLLFHHAYISSPSCTPSRNAILTGQFHWRLGSGGNLWSTLDTKHKTYPNLLEDAGYHVGSWRKSWGPGKLDNWDRHPAGTPFKNPDDFLKNWDKSKPFCFWLGASDPHRGYKLNSGAESGMDLDKIQLFEHYPDSPEIRGDVADYYFEVQRFDRDVGDFLAKLKELGALENTIVVMTGDHGMPFPRCKSNLYDSGARVPLAIQWPKGIAKPGRQIQDFVSTTDFGPTFLAAAGVSAPEAMTGVGLAPIFASENSGQVVAERDHVLTGKERHVMAQEAPDTGGTPMRAIRNHDFLMIRNYRTDRWPAGTPHAEKATVPGAWLADCDNGPTKTYIVDNRDRDDEHRLKYDLSFGKRPEFELYNLEDDPGQMRNVAGNPEYAEVLKALSAQLTDELTATDDPRALGKGDEVFDPVPYLGGVPKKPGFVRKKKK